jgi:hypothetical protein
MCKLAVSELEVEFIFDAFFDYPFPFLVIVKRLLVLFEGSSS